MRLKAETLTTQLARKLSPLYLVSGDEPLQSQEAADAIRAAAKSAGYTERELLEVNRGFDWQQLQQQGQSMSLFAERKLIELRMSSAKPGREGGAAFKAWCERPPEDTLLLITMPRLDRQQQSTAWFRALDGFGDVLQIWPVDAAALPGWIDRRLRSTGLVPAQGVANLIAQRVEGNLLAAAQEIEKLSLLFEAGPIEPEQVLAALCDSSRYDPFVLIDAALCGDTERTTRVLAGLRSEGLAPPQILWALSRELRTLDGILDQQRLGKPLEQGLQSAGVWAKRKPAVRAAASRLRPGQINALLTLCQQCDAASKGADPADPWQLLERISLGICGIRLATRALA